MNMISTILLPIMAVISTDLIGAPYAKVEGRIALLYQNEWWLCTEKSAN